MTRVDRATEALAMRLAPIDDPEARMAARFEQFDTEEAVVRRDVALDRRSGVATAAAIRARIFGTEEAARDGEAADVARRDRGEHTVLTSADLAGFEVARARLAERTGRSEPVPMELRTPEGVATPTSVPTAEELRRAY